MTTMIIAIFPF